ncbi:MAG: type I-E CRISPR-associated protein Cse2/CasB [Longimicrobiaceae bacterium]
MIETKADRLPVAVAVERDSSPEAYRARLARVAAHLNGFRSVKGRRGLLAVFRRMGSGECDIPPEPFWGLMESFHVPRVEETIWLRLLPLVARYPHDPATGPGLAFARARVSAPRLERWLRADHETAWGEADRILARVGEAGVDWVRLGVLLRHWTPELRRALAREFFRSPEYRSRTTPESGA